MPEAHGTETVAAETWRVLLELPRPVMLSVQIESKLGLGPSDHRSSGPSANAEPLTGKRARIRRHTQRT
jgi:hypothetical protein